MTDSEFDAVLRRALTEVIREDYADILEGEPEVPPFTKRHLRWRRNLLADPTGYVRRLARPVWRKALRTAACILLALATLFGAVMAVSPSARAWVVERVTRWTQTYTEFFFTSPHAEGVSADWRPAYIPEGFEEVDASWSEASHTLRLTYEELGGETIYLICKPYALVVYQPRKMSYKKSSQSDKIDRGDGNGQTLLCDLKRCGAKLSE